MISTSFSKEHKGNTDVATTKKIIDAADSFHLFTGKTAGFIRNDESFYDNKGNLLLKNNLLAACRNTAGALPKIKLKK